MRERPWKPSLAKFRDETDLDALSHDLVGVVRETVRPSHVSLWPRPDAASNDEHVEEQPTVHSTVVR